MKIYWTGSPPSNRFLKLLVSPFTLPLRLGLTNWPTGYRRRGAKVILGGLHVLSLPDECATHADAVVLGDGVQLWPRILVM